MTPKKKNGDVKASVPKPPPKPYTPQYGVIVLCDGEKHQEKVYNALRKEGYRCKVVVT